MHLTSLSHWQTNCFTNGPPEHIHHHSMGVSQNGRYPNVYLFHRENDNKTLIMGKRWENLVSNKPTWVCLIRAAPKSNDRTWFPIFPHSNCHVLYIFGACPIFRQRHDGRRHVVNHVNSPQLHLVATSLRQTSSGVDVWGWVLACRGETSDRYFRELNTSIL